MNAKKTKKKYRDIHMRIPIDKWEALKKKAKEQGISVNTLIVTRIRYELLKREEVELLSLLYPEQERLKLRDDKK